MVRKYGSVFSIGMLASAALAGLILLGSRLTTLSFVPLDIADAIIHLTPGAIATQGIENLGPTAKLMIEATGSILFVLLGALVAVSYSRIAPKPTVVAGLLLALVPLVLTVIVQMIAGGLRGGTTGLGLTIILYALWGVVVAWAVNRIFSTPAEPAEDTSRRAFLLQSGGVMLGVALGSTAIAKLLERNGVEQSVAGAAQALPTAASVPTTAPTSAPSATAMPIAAASNLQSTATAAGAPTSEPTAAPTLEPTPAPFEPAPATRSPYNTNETLYVISSGTRDPIVDKGSWKLAIGGAVANPFSITYDELLAMPRVDEANTLECISNEVGNYLIGNCKWNGVRLRDLLERAGLQDNIVDIKFTAAEGYTESIPFAKAMEDTTMIAYGIDGEALAVKHGFPARLRVPGLYGEKNVKWLTKIEAVRDDYQGYWQQRGWTDTAIIETTSVFDTANPFLGTPPPLALENGIIPLGGIAFAGDRGVDKVEVQIDGGDWVEATLGPQENPRAWRFWRYDWAAEPGKHKLVVRATDSTGALQTEAERPPHPDGATGWQHIDVEVTG